MSGARADLPTGLVTFLFTDIEGSTRLLDEMGVEAYGAALIEHRRLLRETFAAHGGTEVDTQGDAFLVAFANAADAIHAAVAAQLSLAQGRIRVRMGVHTGQPHLTDEGYVGEDVHLGARVAAAGHGGQVLLTEPAVEASGESDVVDLGEHRVKDFERAVWIYQVGVARFPPLKTISNTNLPRPSSSFVGRESEIDNVTGLMRGGARLVTLTGPGGTGKTRLAIEASAELISDFKSGVFWVPLAAVHDHTLVVEAIARTLGAREPLANHIGEREMLLVIDNLEQVIDAAPDLTSLVEACPNLRMLVTSRELLRVRGEVEYAVPPLADPESVELFAARSGLAIDATVAELCRRLDNLPLAVELAAARTRVLSPRQILDRLVDRLDLLKGGRDADPRQQTLRATIEWSYDLLQPEEQKLFALLAVFRGGCTLAAAEEIVGADLEPMESLIDKSLVRHVGERFWMLETIREFAAERLAVLADAGDVRRHHAEFFLRLGGEIEPHLMQSDREGWMDGVEQDHDNFRLALDYFERAGEFQPAMRLAGSIVEFWDQRAHHVEALRRFRRLIASDTRPTADRAKALGGAGMIATKTNDMDLAMLWAEEALRLYRELGDEHGVGVMLWGLGFLKLEAGDHVEAEQMLSESIERLRTLGDDAAAMWAMRGLASVYVEIGDAERAMVVYEESWSMARVANDAGLEAATTGALGVIAAEQHRHVDAIAFARKSLGALGGTGDPLIRRSVLCSVAAVIAEVGGARVATQILGYADAQADDAGTREQWVERMNEQTAMTIERSLDDESFGMAWAAGRAMSSESVIEAALTALDDAGDRDRH